MKMNDNLGRSLSIDLVRMTESLSVPGTMLRTRPPEFNVEHAGTTYASMPHGEFAVRIISTTPVELMLFQEGELLISAHVQKGVNYLERDANGAPLTFRAQGDAAPTARPDLAGFGTEGITLLSLGDSSDSQEQSLFDDEQGVHIKNVAPADAGLVFVVARFAKDPTFVGHQPPQVEHQLEFQLSTPEQHSELFAANLSKLVLAALPPDCNDLLSLDAPERPVTQFTCTCTGCKTSR